MSIILIMSEYVFNKDNINQMEIYEEIMKK